MHRHRLATPQVVTAICIAILAGSLAACGGEEETTAQKKAATTDASPQPKDGGGDATGKGDGRPQDKGLLPPGSTKPTPGFRDTSGQTEIPAFGAEANRGERSGAQRALSAYLRAAGEGEWGRACAHIAATTRAQLREIVVQLESAKSQSCGEALRLIAKPNAGEGDPYFGPAEIASLRIKRGGPAGEGAGFALFHGADGVDYWVVMRREGGQWKVVSTKPAELS